MVKLIIAPYKFLSNIWTTKWKNYIDTLVKDYGWKLCEYPCKMRRKNTISFKSFIKKHGNVKCILFWHQSNFGRHLSDTFTDIDPSLCKIYLYYDDYFHPSQLQGQKDSGKYANKIFCSWDLNTINGITPEHKDKYIYLPHAASSEFNCNLNDKAINKVLVSGARNIGSYPWREWSHELMLISDKKEIFDTISPTRYRFGVDRKHIGSGYAEKINEYICSVGSIGRIDVDGKWGYQVASKLFEIPCTGSLLIIVGDDDHFDLLKEFGFVHGDNCYICKSRDEYENIINYVLNSKNRDIVNQIRKNGKEFILNNHMSIHRMKIINDITG